MRFDRATVALAPRTTSNCLDLALLFIRRHFPAVLALWAGMAVPACLATFLLVYWYEYNLLVAVAAFALCSSWFGIVLTIGAAPCAFGEPFTFRDTLRRTRPHTWPLFLVGTLQRVVAGLALCLFVIPGWYVLARTGFFVEQSVLKDIGAHLHDRRADELLKGEIGDLMFRQTWIFAYCALLWLSLRLLGLPIFLSRLQVDVDYLEDPFEVIQYAASFMWNDPVVVTSMLAVALLVYPLARLAWMFCYIDVRVRRDCWDMELEFLQEARRLEEAV
jgi:hypothetical protein